MPKKVPSYSLELMEPRMLLSGSTATDSDAPLVNAPFKPIYVVNPTRPAGESPDATGSPTPIGLTPTEIRGAYAVDQITFGSIKGTGLGQTIGIVDAYDDPTALTDLQAFDAAFNLNDPPSFTKENDLGQTSSLPGTDPDGPFSVTGGSDWEVEESLDIEWAHVIAPDANIVLFEANDPTDLFNTARTATLNPSVTVVSMSFGGPESEQGSSPQVIDNEAFVTPPGHQGITFVASAGDSGIYDEGTDTVDPQYPADSPNVVAVGGTTLNINGNVYGSETAWGNGVLSGVEGGGGGGTSALETQPEYQKFLVTQSATNRTYPDVALDADPATGVPVYDSYDDTAATPWFESQIGGTSLAAPMFAGMVAIADQGRAIDGLGSLNGATQALPRLYQLPEADYHDVISGNDGNAASAGYDLATGRGSPVGNVLVNDLSDSYIGFHVSSDTNLDGIQEQGEVGVSGTQVILMSAGTDGIIGTTDDVPVESSTTDAYGLYELDSPAPGTYYVHFAPTGSYQISSQGAGTDTNENSVADPLTGDTGPIVVTATTQDAAVNASVFLQTITINNVSVVRPSTGLAPAVFTVTLAPANNNTVDVSYATSDGTATVANNDYIPISGELVFAPGVTTQTVTVDAVGNATIENNVTFKVNLTKPTGYSTSNSTGIGTILDSNFPLALVSGAPSFVRSPFVTVAFLFQISLSEAAPFTVSVPYTTVDGTADGNLDYVAQSGVLTFAPGTTAAQPVTVVVTPGTNVQLDKTFFLEAEASSTVSVGSSSEGIGTILTNAIPSISAEPASVTESLTGQTELAFKVDLPAALTGTVSVNYSTFDGSAIAGTDYTSESGTLMFTPGQIQQTVYVPVPQQFVAEQAKTLSFELLNPSSDLTLATTSTTGTIQYQPLVSLAFSARQKAIYTDSLNQRVTVSMKGFGSGQVIFNGTTASDTNAFEILIDGTTSASSVAVKVAGNGQTPFNQITASGSLGTLDAKTANILSSVSVAGSLTSLSLGYLAGSAISVGGAGSGQAVSMVFNRVVNSGITSAIPINSITAMQYLSTDGNPHYITAPSVGSIKVKGNFGGTVQTASIGSVVVGGTLVNAALLTSNSIGSVTAGAISGSTIFAGVDAGVTTLPDSTSDFVNQTSTIGHVTVKSGDLSNSLIAGWTVGTVKAKGVTDSNGGTQFGITAAHVGLVQAKASSLFSAVHIVNPTKSLVDDDFVVRQV